MMTSAQIRYGLPFWEPTDTAMKIIDSKHMLGYRKALGLSHGTSYNSIRQELNILTTRQLREVDLIRFTHRSLKEDNHSNPTYTTIKSMVTHLNSEVTSTLKRKKVMRQQLQTALQEWKISDPTDIELVTKLKKNVMDKTKNLDSNLKSISSKLITTNKTPIYLSRPNPQSWITARIRFNQYWGQYYSRTFQDVDGRCTYPPCKHNGTLESSLHVIKECVQTAHLRAWFEDRLRQHIKNYNFNFSNTIGDHVGIPKKWSSFVEETATTFIKKITQLRPSGHLRLRWSLSS